MSFTQKDAKREKLFEVSGTGNLKKVQQILRNEEPVLVYDTKMPFEILQQ